MEVARVLRLDLLIKLSLAVLLGGIIGFERELSGKPAGLRTNILICLGAALLMDISTRIGLAKRFRTGLKLSATTMMPRNMRATWWGRALGSSCSGSPATSRSGSRRS